MNKALEQLTAKDIMTRELLMAYEGWSIKRLSSFFIKHNISGAPVIASDHSLVGVVTASDLVNFESKSDQEKTHMVEEVYAEFVGFEYSGDDIQRMAQGADNNCTVHQIMAHGVVQVDENALIDDIAQIMLQNGIRRVFVTQNGVMVGVISTTNILEAIVGNAKIPASRAA